MSTSSLSHVPSGPIRAGFETAARTHAVARQGGAVRQIAPQPAGTPVEAAIARAAEATTVDFGYLLAQAEVESAMNPAARAARSSATGLYQFIESTWLDTVRKHGHRFGLGNIADQIGVTPAGSAFVSDPGQRQAILALRADPQVAALMAAGLAEDNRAHLAPILGRQPDHSELYLAHFLGAGGAGRFLSEMRADPNQSAAALFARPAAANRAIFYAPDGSARSLAGVMDVISGKLGRALDKAGNGQAPRLARADYSAPPYAAATPYPIAEKAVFSPAVAAPPAFTPQARMPMSQVLGTAFGSDTSTAPAQVRRAYDRLKAFGL
ncbi:transglycosylase SLT domain-containing protein [Erythrobacter sp. sf7]|uniref:Transglycosylase SLT domain-containing protein n=1 Tax=Erythrobacter fulvus TaxID=2987523 RepID=A0ABT5JS28_9SPHN|nr:transglycosylase SLT domain-containing protein [Erythrobacter fulvus]MDC8755573.1 transglycosylase SLT domain-containing protein [Erythrobacter fulvus]